jgi:hypothetical protein
MAKRVFQAAGAGDEEQRIPPTEMVKARRAARSNGMSEAETEDTIGRLWAWGFLDGPLPNGDQNTIDADLLRDAGRRYAASYWRRYGPVSPRASHFEEMTGRSSGPGFTVIVDEDQDRIAEDRFRARDAALRACGAKQLIDQVCVDGAGDNDPGWLIETINGFPSETRQERVAVASAEAMIGKGDSKAQRAAERRLAEAQRRLKRKIIETRLLVIRHDLVAKIVLGLSELARIDRAEGWHKPKRGRKKTEQEQ